MQYNETPCGLAIAFFGPTDSALLGTSFTVLTYPPLAFTSGSQTNFQSPPTGLTKVGNEWLIVALCSLTESVFRPACITKLTVSGLVLTTGRLTKSGLAFYSARIAAVIARSGDPVTSHCTTGLIPDPMETRFAICRDLWFLLTVPRATGLAILCDPIITRGAMS